MIITNFALIATLEIRSCYSAKLKFTLAHGQIVSRLLVLRAERYTALESKLECVHAGFSHHRMHNVRPDIIVSSQET